MLVQGKNLAIGQPRGIAILELTDDQPGRGVYMAWPPQDEGSLLESEEM